MRLFLGAICLALTLSIIATPLESQSNELLRRVHAQARVAIGIRGSSLGSTDTATRFVAAREAMVRFCYAERGLLRDTTLTGFIFAHVTVDSQGRVDSLTLRPDLSSGWHGRAGQGVQACLADKVRSWVWPAGTRNARFELVFGLVRATEARVVEVPPRRAGRHPR